MTKSKDDLLAAKELILNEKYDEIGFRKKEIDRLSVEYMQDLKAGIRSDEELSEDLFLIDLLASHLDEIQSLINVLSNDIDHAALEMMDAES